MAHPSMASGEQARAPFLSEWRRRLRRPISQILWDHTKTFGKAFVVAGVVLTLLFLFLISIPALFNKPYAAPFFREWPSVNNIVLIVHALTATPPLVIGLFALSKKIRNKSIKWHRYIGVSYCVCIWISALLGIVLASANTHGMVARLGFGWLGVAWFMTTWFAYVTARRKDIVNHRRWMFRSYALTLAVVSVRPLFIMDAPYGLSEDDWYRAISWLCWAPNLLAAEIFIRVTKPNGSLR